MERLPWGGLVLSVSLDALSEASASQHANPLPTLELTQKPAEVAVSSRHYHDGMTQMRHRCRKKGQRDTGDLLLISSAACQ
jgi:hypothetical protein